MRSTRIPRHFNLSGHPAYQTERAKFEAMLRSACPGTPEFELAAVFTCELDASVEREIAPAFHDDPHEVLA